jgi:protein-tyrosine phosphatase
MRSSAVGEDSQASFAGQYRSVLNVDEDNILGAYKKVIASKYSPQAMYYRINYGLTDIETPMAVLALKMIDARTSGIIYTADIDNPDSGHLKIHAIWGLGELLVSGKTSSDIFAVSQSENFQIIEKKIGRKFEQMKLSENNTPEIIPVESEKTQQACLDDETIRQLAEWGMQLESYYQEPQDIEEKSGFEVYYLPIPDESAPDMEDMEKALVWLDEAIYLGKKILVHCRFGVGRTGTFVTSYLLRKGLGLKPASRKMKKSRANPTNFSQWRLLKKYSKKSGILKIREPSLESKHVVDLSTYFAEYEAVAQKATADIQRAQKSFTELLSCGDETDSCCHQFFDVQLIEAIYLSHKMNRSLKSEIRNQVIHNAVEIGQKTRRIKARLSGKGDDGDNLSKALAEDYASAELLCPLNSDQRCLLYGYRPIRCRVHGLPEGSVDRGLINDTLQNLSRTIFFSLSGLFLGDGALTFGLADTVSGKFVQEYFYYLANIESEKR